MPNATAGPPSRLDILCRHLDLDGVGLEIGPSYSPVVSKAVAPRVETVDHATRAELVEKYTGYGLDPELVGRIEDVDYIWTGGSLRTVIPPEHTYDYIVASHFIEHTVDLTLFLADCDALLNSDGVLSLAVPDKRFTFDRFKPLTSLGDVIDGKHRDAAFHPAGALVDHAAYASTLGGTVAWYDGADGPLLLQQPDLQGVPAAEETGTSQAEYVDVHRWIFTPQSFVLLMEDLRELGYHRFEIIELHANGGHEFLVSLRKASGAPDRDRLAALLAVEDELARVAPSTRALAEALNRKKRQVRRLRARNRQLEQELQRVTGSPSRRLTAKLRALVGPRRR